MDAQTPSFKNLFFKTWGKCLLFFPVFVSAPALLWLTLAIAIWIPAMLLGKEWTIAPIKEAAHFFFISVSLGLIISVVCGWIVAFLFALVEWHFKRKYPDLPNAASQIPVAIPADGALPRDDGNPYRYD